MVASSLPNYSAPYPSTSRPAIHSVPPFLARTAPATTPLDAHAQVIVSDQAPRVRQISLPFVLVMLAVAVALTWRVAKNTPGGPVSAFANVRAGAAGGVAAGIASGAARGRTESARTAGAQGADSAPAIQGADSALALQGADSAPAIQAADSAPAIAFVPRGIGTITTAVALYDAPTGGNAGRTLVVGANVAVGGMVHVRAGLARQAMYWVRPEGGGPAVYGFLPADSVALPGLPPPELKVDGVALAQLLTPGDGVTGSAQTGGTAGLGEGGVSANNADQDASGPSSALGTINIPWLPATLDRWKAQFIEAGQRHGVDPELLALVALVESGGNPGARSGSGAAGLMQVMPSTGASIAQARGIAGFVPGQLADPTVNIDFGAWYLAQQMKAFGSAEDPDWQQSVELAAVAYNGGPGTAKAVQSGGNVPNETARYREWVGGMWRERHAPTSGTFEAWMNAGGARLVKAAEAVEGKEAE